MLQFNEILIFSLDINTLSSESGDEGKRGKERKI